MNVAVVGVGYVGLVSGTCFAEVGNQVWCVDIDADKVRRMQQGEVPIYEPDLDHMFKKNTEEGRLHFTTDLQEAVNKCQVIFLALPTPPGEDGSADLKYIMEVAAQLGPLMNDYKVIVDKSTVPIGTAEKVEAAILQNADKSLFDVVSNPEFLREGVALKDFLKPDRVIIGTDSDRAKSIMNKLYIPFVRQGNPIIFMDVRSAEMTKYASNAYLATRITFMNELSNLCDRLGADVDMVRLGMGSDSRIGKRFLFPGIGFGGSCFPKDVSALLKTAESNDYAFRVLKSVLEVNADQRIIMVEKIRNKLGADLQGKKIAIWGLAFKPNTDDIREAPALYIIEELLQAGATVTAYDPEAMENIRQHFGNRIKLAGNQYEALQGADALAILTEWAQFRTPDFDRMKETMQETLIFDGRNVFMLDQMKDLGFYYESMGREKIQG